MQESVEHFQHLPIASLEVSSTPLQQAGRVLREFAAETGIGTRHQRGQVLELLARHASEPGEAGQRPLTTAYLKEAIAPSSAKDPSAWMSPHWANLLAEESGWQGGLADIARRAGSNYVPRLFKTDGNPAHYGIDAISLPETDCGEQPEPLPAGGVRYTAELTVDSAWWIRWCFQAGSTSWSIRTRGLLVVALLSGLAVVLLLFLTASARASGTAGPLLFRDVWLLVMLAFTVWVVLRAGRYFEDLVDLRVVMAPLALTKSGDWGVTLELRSPEKDDRDGRLVMAKYRAACTMCDGGVRICDGGAAFPARLVGRCERSPREHVYSFDHALRIGRPLQ
jgi:hypothetical protein